MRSNLSPSRVQSQTLRLSALLSLLVPLSMVGCATIPGTSGAASPGANVSVFVPPPSWALIVVPLKWPWSVNGMTRGNSAIGAISSRGQYTPASTVTSPPSVTVTANGRANPTAITVNGVAAATDSISVQLIGTTATQAVLSYTAPDTSSCTLRVRESGSSPLVHDVDPALFPGSDTDAGGAPRRFWVIGKRTVERATDGRNYSRALQADTPHNFLLTCNGQSTEGTFTTSNIANGNTYEDTLPVLFPTVPDTSGYAFVDPLTGALIKRFGLDGDTVGGHGQSKGWDAGSVKMCAYTLVSGGYFCDWPTTEGFTRLYWVNPKTGVTNFLGVMRYSSGTDFAGGFFGAAEGNWDPSDPNEVWAIGVNNSTPGKPILIKATYTGRLTSQPPNTSANYTAVNLTPTSFRTLADLIAAFDPHFNVKEYGQGCVAHGVQQYGGHEYLMISCRRWYQDSPAWLVVVDLGNKEPLGSGGTLSVVAAMTTFANTSFCRWCGHHSTYYIEDQPIMYWLPQNLVGFGTGKYEVSLTSDVNRSTTSFAVSGEPTTSGSNIPPDGGRTLQDAAAGDIFVFEDGTNEEIQITNKVSSTSWIVGRGCHAVPKDTATEHIGVISCDGTNAASHSSGALAFAAWSKVPNQNGGDTWWSFLNDPHGQDTTNTNLLMDLNQYDGHHVTRTFYTTGVDVMENNTIRLGDFPAQYTQQTTRALDNQPLFDGVSGFANGEAYQKHPSYDQADAPASNQTWFLDSWPFSATGYADSATLVAGKKQTYQYNLGRGNTFNIYKLPYFGVSGGATGGPSPPSNHRLKDISGTGSVLPDDSNGDYEMCVAHVTNECISGSSAGRIYFNVPSLTYPYCRGGNTGPPPGRYDICIQNTAAYGQAVDQFGLLPTNQTGTLSVGTSGRIPLYGAGLSRRLVLGGYAPYRLQDGLANAHVLPDGSWAVYQANVTNTTQTVISALMVKIPPQPANDGKDRTNFIPISVQTSSRIAGATQVVVDFGDDPVNFYCTQRAEGCRATSSTYNASQPFYFKTTDTYTGVTPGQNVIVPCKPEHVVYYRVVYLDARMNMVQIGAVQVALDAGN
jgi:hypothetical protein